MKIKLTFEIEENCVTCDPILEIDSSFELRGKIEESLSIIFSSHCLERVNVKIKPTIKGFESYDPLEKMEDCFYEIVD